MQARFFYCRCGCSRACSGGSSWPLADAHAAGRLAFFGELGGLRSRSTFAAYLAPLRNKNWFVYAKPPFAGPEAVLAYLARYTHRVAISNSRLIALDEQGVRFRYKDYRRDGRMRFRTINDGCPRTTSPPTPALVDAAAD